LIGAKRTVGIETSQNAIGALLKVPLFGEEIGLMPRHELREAASYSGAFLWHGDR
jgi:hypothetical protein